VPGSGWEDGYISGLDGDCVAALSAQHDPCVAGREAEDFVGGRVIVVEIVHPIPPLGRPAIPLKNPFVLGCGVLVHREDASVQKNRQLFVVRNPAVAREVEQFGLAGAVCGLSEKRPSRSHAQSGKYGGKGASVHHVFHQVLAGALSEASNWPFLRSNRRIHADFIEMRAARFNVLAWARAANSLFSWRSTPDMEGKAPLVFAN
jgi:hypothetical protein